ncbi:MAG: long-chain fatty acid--CoA ligase [Bacteroidota bacterium]
MDFHRLFDLFYYQQAKYPNKVALASKRGLKWKTYTTAECLEQIERVSAGLLQLGLVRGDKVAIMTQQGCPEWNFLDMGMQQIGVIAVPLHATLGRKELLYILQDAEIKYCIVQDRELYVKVAEVQDSVLSLKGIYTITEQPDLPHWTNLTTMPTAKHLADIQAFKAAIHEDDLATIIYTSGTTGEPKGVMLSHKNIVSNIKSTIALIPLNCDKVVLSFLPLSHIFERMATYTYIAVGASLHYAQRLDLIQDNLREIRPHYLTAVPRLIEKMYDGIQERANALPTLLRRMYLWSVKVGEQYPNRKISFFYWWKLQFAYLIAFRRWQRLTGGRIEGVLVGAAALQPRLNRLFTAAGFNLKEGYGLTETSPIIAFNRFEPGGWRTGTVGIPLPILDLKIDTEEEEKTEEGEILVKGPNVMLGYYKKPEETAKVLNEEGWFRTGDVGKIVHKRFLQITDRKKDIFKTSHGKYVAPQQIENLLKSTPFIEQCLIIGFKKAFVTALIVPNFTVLERWCEENEVHWTAPQYMVINPKIEQLFSDLIDGFNEKLLRHEEVRKHHLLHEEWTVENGLFTPTMKAKREAILEQYDREVKEMYG